MNPIPLSNKNFQKIIQFYLFESPVRTYQKKKRGESVTTAERNESKYVYEFHRVSKRGLTFADRNLGGVNLNSLRAAMSRVTGVKLIVVDSIDEVTSKASSIDPSAEYVIIRRNEDNVSVTEGYYYCIRNALAHGDFDVNGEIYTFRNEMRGKVKGLARITETSLLTWIEIVGMGIEDIKKAGK